MEAIDSEDFSSPDGSPRGMMKEPGEEGKDRNEEIKSE